MLAHPITFCFVHFRKYKSYFYSVFIHRRSYSKRFPWNELHDCSVVCTCGHGRSQDFRGGRETLFQKNFKKFSKKYSKNFQKIFKKFSNKYSKYFQKIFKIFSIQIQNTFQKFSTKFSKNFQKNVKISLNIFIWKML